MEERDRGARGLLLGEERRGQGVRRDGRGLRLEGAMGAKVTGGGGRWVECGRRVRLGRLWRWRPSRQEIPSGPGWEGGGPKKIEGAY